MQLVYLKKLLLTIKTHISRYEGLEGTMYIVHFYTPTHRNLLICMFIVKL